VTKDSQDSSQDSRPILFAENEEDDIVLTGQALKEAGVANPLIGVPDGREAIRYLQGEGRYADRVAYPAPCLLLLDLKMPCLTGLGVLIWLREHPEVRSKLPVVVLSSWDDQADVHEATALGAADYLLKPTRFEELIELMREVKRRWLDVRVQSAA
jgi:CheY-like chemotaxis protein